MLREHRQGALRKVTERALGQLESDAGADGLESLLNETQILERVRLKRERSSREVRQQRKFWERVGKTFYKLDAAGQRALLAEAVEGYAREIAGGFSPSLYHTVSRLVPVGLNTVWKRLSPLSYLKDINDRTLGENMVVKGPLEAIRELAARGTLMVTPTHLSNFDSIVLGYSLFLSRLPPLVYGAGLNLFSNPVVSFLMSNLGAYKVDRKKQNTVYKGVLKAYCVHTLELGYHNLFFPGGTRSRSGAVEAKLKLGLLGCGLEAYIQNLRGGSDKPNIYVVPCTINYGLVLEAETLITDFLADTGKRRFIITNDESSRWTKVIRFLRKLGSLHSRIQIQVAPPLDLFGNRVDAQGISRDSHGRPVDTSEYVRVDGAVAQAPQRDREYTRILGERIVESLYANNVAMATHVVAFAFWTAHEKQNPGLDLFKRLRAGEAQLPFHRVLDAVEGLMRLLRARASENRIHLDPEVAGGSPGEVVDKCLQGIHSYHGRHVLRLVDGNLVSKNLKLVYYYHNRLIGYGLEREADRWLKPQRPL